MRLKSDEYTLKVEREKKKTIKEEKRNERWNEDDWKQKENERMSRSEIQRMGEEKLKKVLNDKGRELNKK